MPILLTCPECDATLKLAAPPPEGKKVKCPKCAAVFLPETVEERRLSADRPVAPARPRSRPAYDDDDEDDRPRRPRRKKSQGGSGLLIGLLVGGGVLAVLILGCAGAGVFAYFRARPATRPQPVAQVNNPAPAVAPFQNPNPNPDPNINPNPNPNPNGLGGNGAGQEGNKGADNGAQPPVMPPVMPPMPGPGGLPGNQAQITLSNPRVSHLGLRMNITVDYRFTQGGPAIGQHIFVIIKSARNTYEANIFPTHVQNEGTFDLGGIAFGGPDRGPFEIWVETGLPGPFGPRQKISNTVTAN
jgi:Zn-finger nucleic acid-binding protein